MSNESWMLPKKKKKKKHQKITKKKREISRNIHHFYTSLKMQLIPKQYKKTGIPLFACILANKLPFQNSNPFPKQFPVGFPKFHPSIDTELGLGECIRPDPPTCYLRPPSAAPYKIGGHTFVRTKQNVEK